MRPSSTSMVIYIIALFMISSATPNRAGAQEDDQVLDDTVDIYLRDDLLRLQLNPLPLVTCTVDELARLPGISYDMAQTLLDAVDCGAIRTWSDVRDAIAIDTQELMMLKRYTRLPARRSRRNARRHVRVDISTSSPKRRGALTPLRRVVRQPGGIDTIEVGDVFAGSGVAIRAEGAVATDDVSIVFRTLKESYEPWSIQDTLRFAYSNYEFIDTMPAHDSVVHRRGSTLGFAATFDRASWGVILGDFRTTELLPGESLARSSPDHLRRLTSPGQPTVSPSPVASEVGYLRGMAIRIGPARSRTAIPTLTLAHSIRSYVASSHTATTRLSSDGTHRTRQQLRRSGGVWEQTSIVGARYERRRWGTGVIAEAWRRHSSVAIDTSSHGWSIESSVWTRVGRGLARCDGRLWFDGIGAGGGIVLPVASGVELSSYIRYVHAPNRVLFPSGTATPGTGMEWSLAARWRPSRFELTDVQFGGRTSRQTVESPFGDRLVHAGLSRSVQAAQTYSRIALTIESMVVRDRADDDGRIRTADQVNIRFSARNVWRMSHSSITADAGMSISDLADQRRSLALSGSVSMLRTFSRRLAARARMVLFLAESPTAVYDVAPSFRGSSMPITLSGRGGRLQIEGRIEPLAGATLALGLDYRGRSDRLRILSNGDDTIDGTDVTTVWINCELR